MSSCGDAAYSVDAAAAATQHFTSGVLVRALNTQKWPILLCLGAELNPCPSNMHPEYETRSPPLLKQHTSKLFPLPLRGRLVQISTNETLSFWNIIMTI